jgi:hypothetical protein
MKNARKFQLHGNKYFYAFNMKILLLLLTSLALQACNSVQYSSKESNLGMEFAIFMAGEKPLILPADNSDVIELRLVMNSGERTMMPKGSPGPKIKYLLRDMEVSEKSVTYFDVDLNPLNFKSSQDKVIRLKNILLKYKAMLRHSSR